MSYVGLRKLCISWSQGKKLKIWLSTVLGLFYPHFTDKGKFGNKCNNPILLYPKQTCWLIILQSNLMQNKHRGRIHILINGITSLPIPILIPPYYQSPENETCYQTWVWHKWCNVSLISPHQFLIPTFLIGGTIPTKSLWSQSISLNRIKTKQNTKRMILLW